MKKFFTLLIAFSLIVLFGLPAQAGKKKQVVNAVGGASVGNSGLIIDAGYDPRLDSLVPGYKVINAIIINHSYDIINLSPEKDEWSIKLDGDKRTVKLIHDMRSQVPGAWSEVPEKARTMLSYPLVIPVGAREIIDLFVSDRVDAEKFTQLNVYLDSMATKFEILVRQ